MSWNKISLNREGAGIKWDRIKEIGIDLIRNQANKQKNFHIHLKKKFPTLKSTYKIPKLTLQVK